MGNRRLLGIGVSESVIMAITGHATREMFDRYNEVDSTDKQQAVAQMDAFFKNVDQMVDQEELTQEKRG